MLTVLLLLMSNASGEATGQSAPSPVDEIARCRKISESAARLACFDRAADALNSALQAHDLRVVDRQEVEETRRSLFGFSVRTTPILQDDSRRGVEEIKEFTGKIEQVRAAAYGRFEVTLHGGAIWTTTEPLPRDPRPGQDVTIKKGVMNSYFMRIDGGRSVKGRRIG